MGIDINVPLSVRDTLQRPAVDVRVLIVVNMDATEITNNRYAALKVISNLREALDKNFPGWVHQQPEYEGDDQ